MILCKTSYKTIRFSFIDNNNRPNYTVNEVCSMYIIKINKVAVLRLLYYLILTNFITNLKQLKTQKIVYG